MKNKTISFILPSRDNLKYLAWSYNSIRKNLGYRHEIIIGDDASTDGTWEWLKEIKEKDKNVIIDRNNTGKRWGLTIYYDLLVKKSRNDIIIFWHADMYACPDMDKEVLKHLIKGKTVVCPTRIEPPLHPPGNEKIISDFGLEPENFKEIELLDRVRNVNEWELIPKNQKTTEGIFAPWIIYKDDFLSINGHDPLFAPQSREDSDAFARFHLAGFKFIQTWRGFVYHLTSRGSRFRDGIHKNSSEWLQSNQRNMRNFIRKYGSGVQHDKYLKPIVSPVYDIGFVITNCNLNIMHQLEILCDAVYSDISAREKQVYISTNQAGTLYSLDKRLRPIDVPYINDIIVKFDGSKLTNENFQYLVRLNEILYDSGEIGNFILDIFDIEIKQLKDYKNTLIIADKSGNLR